MGETEALPPELQLNYFFLFSLSFFFFQVIGAQRRRSPSALAIEVFEAHLGSHILQVPLKESSFSILSRECHICYRLIHAFGFRYTFDYCYFFLESTNPYEIVLSSSFLFLFRKPFLEGKLMRKGGQVLSVL